MEKVSTMKTEKQPVSDWQWFKGLKWWKKIIVIDWGLAFCGLCIEDPHWAIALNVANFAVSTLLLNKYVEFPDNDEE